MNILRHLLGICSLVTASALAAQFGPPPESDFGGASPLNQREWLTPSDYPSASIAANEMGEVKIEFEILANGNVGACKVVRSSGHARLDNLPCPLLKRRARFIPAKDANGVATPTTGTTEMRFWFSE